MSSIAEPRHPRTNATVDQLLDRYLDQFDGAPNTLTLTGGYVGKHISPFLGHLKLGQLDPDAVTATGAGLHKHYRPGRWVSASFGGSACAVAQPPVLVAAIYDVLPLEARLDRVALIDSAAGELWPVSASP